MLASGSPGLCESTPQRRNTPISSSLQSASHGSRHNPRVFAGALVSPVCNEAGTGLIVMTGSFIERARRASGISSTGSASSGSPYPSFHGRVITPVREGARPLPVSGSPLLRDSPYPRASGANSTLSPASRLEQAKMAHEMFIASTLSVRGSDSLTGLLRH